MSEPVRDSTTRERADALAALREPDAAESVVAHQPTAGHVPVPPTASKSPSPTALSGGLLAVLVAVDQALQQQGSSLADAAVRSGSLLGPLVSSWPIVLLLVWAFTEARRRWQAHVDWSQQRAAAEDAARTRQERLTRALVRAIHAVDNAIERLRSDLSHEAAEREGLAGRVASLETKVGDLQRRMPDR